MQALNNAAYESLRLARRVGILNQAAPSWEVAEWIQLPGGKITLDVDDFKVKVRFNDFPIYEADAIRLIDGLVKRG